MKPSPEIEAIVRRLVASRIDQDAAVFHSYMSESDDLVSIGSDEHEWNRGRELFNLTRATGEAIPVAEIDVSRLEGFEEGTVGWAAWQENRTMGTVGDK